MSDIKPEPDAADVALDADDIAGAIFQEGYDRGCKNGLAITPVDGGALIRAFGRSVTRDRLLEMAGRMRKKYWKHQDRFDAFQEAAGMLEAEAALIEKRKEGR